MQKRILFVITKSNWGGAQRYVYDLATKLPSNNFIVTVAAGGQGALIDKLKEKGIRVITIPYLERDINLIKETHASLALWKIFQKEQPDIIHLNSSKIGGLGALFAYVARLYNKLVPSDQNQPIPSWKIIFTVHGWAFNEDRSKISRYIIRLIQWITALLCDSVIIISHRDYRQAIHLPMVNRKKFVLIPLGIPNDTLAFLPKSSARVELAQRSNTKISSRNFVIGVIAELTKNKGLPYFVNAISHLQSNETIKKNLQIVIIGEGEDREKLSHLIAARELQNNITLAGFIASASQYLKAFDVFVLPSIKEGLPYTLIEAMHAQIPIISTRVGGVPDLIEHNVNGIIVPSKNSGALALAIEQLLNNKTMRASFAKESGKKIETKFSFEMMLSSTIRLYNDI